MTLKGKKKGLTHKSIVAGYADIWSVSCQNNLKYLVFWIPVRVEKHLKPPLNLLSSALKNRLTIFVLG